MSGKVIEFPTADKLNDPVSDKCICFRKIVDVKKNIISANIKIYSNSKYILYINTQPVIRASFKNDDNYGQYQVMDIKDFITEGKNTFAVMCYTGDEKRLSLYISGCINFDDGTVSEISSDSSFKCACMELFDSDAPFLYGFKYRTEVFNNAKYDEKWLERDYDDSSWLWAKEKGNTGSLCINERKILTSESESDAKVIIAAGAGREANTDLLLHKQIFSEVNSLKLTHMYVMGTKCEMKPLDKGNFNYMLVDFDKTVTGFIKLNIEGYENDIVDVCFASELVKERPRINSFARFILKGGKNFLETRFQKDTFRYALIIFRNYIRTDRVERISAVELSADVCRRDDTPEYIMLNVTDEISYPDRELSICEREVYFDFLKKYYNDTTFMKNYVCRVISNQLSSGKYKLYRDIDRISSDDENMAFVLLACKCSGYLNDFNFTSSIYNSIINCLDCFIAEEDNKGLLCRGDKAVLESNLLYLNMLRAIKNISKSIGQTDAQVFLGKKIKKLKKRLKDFYDPSLRVYSEYIKDGERSKSINADTNILAINSLCDKIKDKENVIINIITDSNTQINEYIPITEKGALGFAFLMKRAKRTGEANELLNKLNYDIADMVMKLADL